MASRTLGCFATQQPLNVAIAQLQRGWLSRDFSIAAVGQPHLADGLQPAPTGVPNPLVWGAIVDQVPPHEAHLVRLLHSA